MILLLSPSLSSWSWSGNQLARNEIQNKSDSLKTHVQSWKWFPFPFPFAEYDPSGEIEGVWEVGSEMCLVTWRFIFDSQEEECSELVEESAEEVDNLRPFEISDESEGNNDEVTTPVP